MRKIVGVFHSYEAARRAVEDLKAQGYDHNSISLIAKDSNEVQRVAHDTNMEESVSAENAAIGATTGGLLGGLGGILLGIGALAIPGIGPIVAAGPIAAGLTGAAVGAAGGGLLGALTGIGIDETEAREYETYFNQGEILVVVDTDDTRMNNVYDSFSRNSSLNTKYYPEQYRR